MPSNTDPFQVLGVAARFDLDEATLAAARDRVAGDPAAAAAWAIVSDPARRAEVLLSQMGGPSAEAYAGVPSGFDSQLAAARGSSDSAAALAALYEEHVKNIAQLFVQLRSADKGPVQAGRQRMIRLEINAVKAAENP